MKDDKLNIYVAGSLFSAKEIVQRIKDEELLKQALPKANIYNPITQPFNQKSSNPTPKDIFWGDAKQVLKADILTIDGDDIDKDSGVAFETGIAFTCNYMLNLIQKYAPLEVYDKISKEIPYKRAYSVVSDIRQDSTGEEGLNKSWGHNVFTYAGLLELGDVYKSMEDAVQDLKNDFESEDDK